MELSTTIRLTEAAIDQAITEGQPITNNTIVAMKDAMLEWAQTVEQMEAQHQSDRDEIAELRVRLNIPEALSDPNARFENVVPIDGEVLFDHGVTFERKQVIRRVPLVGFIGDRTDGSAS